MPVKKHADGRRSVEAQVEVPGAVDDVWRAIATGPGISAWFVPSEVEERQGGAAVSHFSPDGAMDAVGTITEWAPPHRFVVEGEEGPGTVASEWTVEAKDGGTCVVRVVHSWFADSDDWDDQFEGHSHGWVSFFRILRLYCAHFIGQSAALAPFAAQAAAPKEAAWRALLDPLGLFGAPLGDKVATSTGAPPLDGVVEWAGQPAAPEELLLRLAKPAPGAAHLFAMPMGDVTHLSIRLYLYGDQAESAAAAAEPVWRDWLAERFAADATKA